MKKTLVSLFSGCGGLDVGFMEAGFEVIWANDFNADAVKTYENNIGKHIVLGDITKVSSSSIPDSFDVLTGGFPCQGFSISNHKRTMNDKRNFLYLELLRVIRDKKPKVFLAENVKGLMSMEKGKVLDMILDDFRNIGYDVEYRLLKASDYGVPQNRERVIILGNRIGVENIFPEKTHTNRIELVSDLKTHISVKEAISFLEDERIRDVPFMKNGEMIYNHVARTNVASDFWARKYSVSQSTICEYLKEWRDKAKVSVKQIDKLMGYSHTAGHWFRSDSSGSIPRIEDWWELKKILGFDDTYDEVVTSLIQKPISYEQSLRVSNWDSPSDTITASGPEIHPNKQRRLSVRECAILQSFPMDFIFEGSMSSMYRQVGNAVPSKLAYHLGLGIKKMLE